MVVVQKSFIDIGLYAGNTKTLKLQCSREVVDEVLLGHKVMNREQMKRSKLRTEVKD